RRAPFSPRRRHPPSPTLFPYTTLFRSRHEQLGAVVEDPVAQRQQVGVDRALTARGQGAHAVLDFLDGTVVEVGGVGPGQRGDVRSEEHTSELQSRFDLVCRLLLEKKKQ